MNSLDETQSILAIINRMLGKLRRRWSIVGLIIASSIVVFLSLSFLIKPKYLSTSTMMLESSKGALGGGLAGAMDIANSLGILGGAALTVDDDKLIELLRSRRIVYAALLSKATVGGKIDYLANHYLDAYDYTSALADEPSTKGFRFTHGVSDSLTFLEDSLMSDIYEHIVKKQLKAEKIAKSGLISLNLELCSEELSLRLNKALLSNVNDFYYIHKTDKQAYAVEVISVRVDSIKYELDRSENKLASIKDANFSQVKAMGLTDEQKLRRQIQILNIMYGEALKNLELSKFNLMLSTPVIQVIDLPVLPLEKKYLSKKFALLFGFLAGIGFSLIYLVIPEDAFRVGH